MKRNKFKRLIAALLSAVMVCGMAVPSFAANTVAVHSDAVSDMMEDVAPFTTTEDLIEQVKQRLYNEGKLILPQQEDEALVEAVETSSDYSFEQAKSMLSHSFFAHRDGAEGEINTARLNLSKADMKELVKAALKSSYLEDTVEVAYKVKDGIVAAIDFQMRESFAMGLDDIQANGEAAAAQQALAEAAEAEEDVVIEIVDETEAVQVEKKAEKSWNMGWLAPDEGQAVACTHSNTAALYVWAEDAAATYGYTCDIYLYCVDCSDTDGYLLVSGAQSATVNTNSESGKLEAWVGTEIGGYFTVPEATHIHTDATAALWTEEADGMSAQAYTACECGLGEVVDCTVTEENTADCTTDGEIVYTASVGTNEIGTYSVPSTATGHDLDEVAETETHKAHYVCGTCGDLFADAAGTTPTTLDELSKVCTHSDTTFVPAVDATCDTDGKRAHCVCNGCGALMSVTNDANGGYKGHTVLNETEIANLTIPASHTLEEVAETDNQKAHYACSGCGAQFLDAAGEQPAAETDLCKHGSYIPMEKVDADCQNTGHEAYFICRYCAGNFEARKGSNGNLYASKLLTDEEFAALTIPTGAHSIEYVSETETHVAHYICSVCEERFRDEAGTEPATLDELVRPCEHGNFKHVERREPGCETPGHEAYYVCGKCESKLEARESSSGGTYAGAVLTEEEFAALEIPATGHGHELLDAVWAPAYVYYTDDGTITGNILNQNPDPYGAPYIIVEVDGVPTQISTMALVYDPTTKSIGYAPAVALYNWTCTEFTVGCEDCGESVAITDNITITSVTYDDAYFAANPSAMATMMGLYGSTVYTATYTGEEGTFTSDLNGTQRQLMQDWAVLCKFNADHAEYYGAPAPYWTSKNSEESPLGAMTWLTNMQEEDFIPDSTMQYMVNMLTQAFMSYVLQYGEMLLAMKEDALASVSIGMTDIQVYLMLHEWISKYATFDMQNMVDQMSGGSAGSDPITMTPFGTLLADQLNLNGVGDNGGVCLGYTATYVWLVQSAFKEMGKFGNNIPYSYFIENPVVDFVQIKYLTNVEDASVADGDSGFGAGETMFNSPHYFNAVKALNTATNEYNWYYVDAAYDDINVETISQYRVETDGNISHANFMLSPVSMEDQYEGKFQFLDSLYDGVQWRRVPTFDENNQFLGYQRMKEDGTVLSPAEADFYEKYEGGQTFYYYERVELTEEEQLATGDIPYDDDTYEQTWFSNAISEITYDKKSGAFYYVEGVMNSYTAMKDMLGDDGGSSIFDGMSTSELEEYTNDPAYSDELRARPIGASDLPSNYGEDNDNSMMGGMEMYEDEESIVIFHYGFGTYGADAQASSDEHGGNSMTNDDEEYTEEDFGPFYEEILEDEVYRDRYPELSHSVIVHNGTLYFNLGTKIFTYDLSKYTAGTYTILNSDGEIQFPRGEINQLKEYVDVTFGSDGRRFTGMSYYTDPSVWAETTVDGQPVVIEGPQTIYYHPIAALCLKNDIQWTNEIDPETGMVIRTYRDLIPTLYVSIGTNYANSYKGTSGVAYAEEAVNYNPNYYRFMDDNRDDNENTNTEFMWCANVVDKMVMETLLNDKTTETVTYGAYCEKPGFTETRSTIYGLSDGSTKTALADDPGHYHSYDIHPVDKTLVCTVCLKAHDATIEQPTNADDEVEDYIDTHKHTEITEDDVTFEWYTKEDGTQGCRAKLYCEEEYCDRNSVWHECEVTGEGDTATATVTIVVKDVDSKGNIVETTLTFTGFRGALGDVNQDGKVNIFDLARLRLAVENRTTDQLLLSTSDVNSDGKIDIFDVARLRLHIDSRGQVALG